TPPPAASSWPSATSTTSSRRRTRPPWPATPPSGPRAAGGRGGGGVMAAFGPAGPHAATLDAVVADRPVLLESTDGHSAWVNRRALELAGTPPGRPDPHPRR